MVTQALANQFVDHPGEFLKKCIVEWKGGAPEDQTNIQAAMLDSDWGRRRTTVLHRKVDATGYVLRHAFTGNSNVPEGSARFDAVWSGYKGGQSRTAHLSSFGGPGIMLTPQLSGCTVVCAFNQDGSAEFSHYNLKDEGAGGTLDKQTMRAIAFAVHGRPVATLSREDYRALGKHSDMVRVNVVGCRKGGRWEFWAQFTEEKNACWHIRQVRRIT
jgi:hypothetical protein